MSKRVSHITSNVVIHLILSFMIVFMVQGVVFAQSTTNVSITGIPGILPSPFFSDFEQNVYNGVYQVQVNVVGNSSVNVRFNVTVSKDGQELVDETSLPVELKPGMNMLSPFPNFVEFSKTMNQVMRDLPSDMVQQVIQGGTFPEGDYTITMQGYEVGSNIPAGSVGIANFMVRYPQPSALLFPANATEVGVNFPVFSWTPVLAPRGTTIEYDFLLVEVFDRQNPGDALLSNREHASVQVIGTTALPYTGEYLPLEQGKTYAWQVTARDANDQIPIKNDGRSEIYTFTFQESQEEPDEEEDEIVEIPAPGLEFIPMPIPVSTISGNIQWSFSPTEGGFDLQTMFSEHVQDFHTTGNIQAGTTIDDPNYESDTSLDNTVPIFGGGHSTGAQSESFDMLSDQMQQAFDRLTTYPLIKTDVKAVYKKPDGSTKVLATGTADENGDFTLSFVPSELAGLSESESAGLSTSWGDIQPQDINVDDLTNQSQRNFSESTFSRETLHIVVDSPYFSFQPETAIEVNTNSNEQLDVGTLTGMALTYRFRANVVDRSGVPIPDATIEIFRSERWYDTAPELQPEGYPLDRELRGIVEFVSKRNHIKVAETSSEGLITRLFPRKQGGMDRYTIRVSARGYETLVTYLSASPVLSENDVVTVKKEYRLQAAPPLVEGRIIRGDTDAPMTRVRVGLVGTDYITETDEDGRFTISNIEPRENEYTLLVAGRNFANYKEQLLLNENGIIVDRDPIVVDPTLITVVGYVENERGNRVANAKIQWEKGGAPVQTDLFGRFVTTNTVGTHRLKVSKIGHREADTTLTVQLTEEAEYEYSEETFGAGWSPDLGSSYSSAAGQWAGNLMKTDTFQNSVEQEGIDTPVFSPGSLGFFGSSSSTFNINENETSDIIDSNNLNINHSQFGDILSYFGHLFEATGIPGDFYDAGAIVINRAVGKLDVTVQDSDTGDPIADAVVEVGHGGLQGTTDSDGHIYFDEAPGGSVPVSISAPETTFYVPLTTEVTITDNGEITYIDIPLESGSRAMGVVTANGEPVEDASVRVEGRDDISTTTDSDGNYILAGIPAGEWTLRTTASGLVGASETRDFTAEEEVTINFNLQDAGFNIATLLGFDIEVDEISTAGDTTLTGAFVSIPSNPLLSVSDDLRIPFSGIQVYEEGGDLRPVGGEVQTDVSELQAELFDFLIVTVSNQDGLIVRPREMMSDIGYIAGLVEADYAATFTSATGWQWPNVADQYLKIPNTSDLPNDIGENELVTLTSDGSFPFPDIGVPDFELEFGSASSTFSVYGFDVELSLNESVLKNDGFHLSGDVHITDIPMLDTATIELETLRIGTNGSVRETQLKLDPVPELALADWKMKVMSGALSETGFSLGGAVELNIPGSEPAEMTFSDLFVTSEQIFWGEFVFPAEGIDVFGIVDLQSRPGTDISLGKVQNEDVYYVTGAAEITPPKYIDRDLIVDYFLIRTDGEFDTNIAANFSTDFWGLADLSVTGVQFQNTSGPAMHVDGKFGLHGIPFVSAQAGGLTYQPGGSVSFEQLDFEFDLASIGTIGAGIGLIDTAVRQGFSGSGMMEITGTPISADIDFYYERADGGIAFGGNVETGTSIPVGIFAIENVGGGFSFDRPNDHYSVTLSGRVAAAPGTGHAISLDPLQLTVASGPVITGNAGLSVMSQQISDAEVSIDFPNRLFSIEAAVGFNRLESINIDAQGSAAIVLSGAQDNSYWMVGARYKAELFSLFNANANLLAAWDFNVSANPEYSEYTDFLSEDYITGGTINGIHLDVGVEYGISEDNARCFGGRFGEICGYYENRSRCEINADFAGSNYGFLVGSGWEVGAWATIGHERLKEVTILGIEGSLDNSISGNYNNGIWSAKGTGETTLHASAGSCPDECANRVCRRGKIFPSGGSICITAGVEVEYNSLTGLDISVTRN